MIVMTFWMHWFSGII